MSLPNFDEVMPRPEGSDIHLAVQARRAGKIKGESVARDHADEIIVRSWSWGLSAGQALGSTQSTVRRSYQELSIVKGIDAATTPLMSALATNDELREVVLTMRKPGERQIDFFKVKLNEARVVSVRHASDAAGATTETVGIAFRKVEVQYTPQQSGGSGGAATTFTDEVLPA